MVIRQLTDENMQDFVDLIKQLSPQASLGSLTDRSAFIGLCRLQNKTIFLAYDEQEKIVGTASVFLEDKINRGTNPTTGQLYKVAHIEEVVVDSSARGKGVGKDLMAYCINFSRLAGAYKLILECSEDNVAFYEKCGLHRHEVAMRIDL